MKIRIEDLSLSSHIKYRVICDYCGEEYLTSNCVAKSKRIICKNGKHCCKKCAKNKIAESFIERYGVISSMQLPKTVEKQKETLRDKYGVENVSQLDSVKEAKKNSYISHYGVEHYFMTDEFSEKSKQTCLNKYGAESVMQMDFVKEKRRKTCLQKYGVESASKLPEVQAKYRNTCLQRFGYENAAQSPEIIEKIKNSFIDKYGVSFAMGIPEVREKIRQTCFERYGVEYVGSYRPFVEKRLKTTAERFAQQGNGIATSKAQLQTYNLLYDAGYNVVLNYLANGSFYDVALWYDGIKIDIEYDGTYWHRDSKKDERRDAIAIKDGWKILRIKGDSAPPTKEQLLEAVSFLLMSSELSHVIYTDDYGKLIKEIV